MNSHPTISVIEIALFLAALFGVVHHILQLLRITKSCRGVMSCADKTLCNIYLRQEWTRLVFTVLVLYGGVWMMTRPPVVGDTSIAPLVWRLGLVLVVIIMNIESVLAWRDRNNLGK